jgi:hypothetical protein
VPVFLGTELTAVNLTNLLRFAALAAAVGSGFLLDDAALRTVVAVPVPHLLGRVVRLLVALPVLGLWWAAAVLLTVHGTRGPGGDGVLTGALTVEAATLCAVGLAVAAVRLRTTDDGSAGPLAGPVVLLAAAATLLLPDRWGLFVDPTSAGWADAHQRWAGVLAVASVVWVVASRSRSQVRMASVTREPLRRR